MLGLAACSEPSANAAGPRYSAVDALGIGTDVVNLLVSTSGTDSDAAVRDFATCAVAGFATRRGYDFARPVRIITSNEAGIWSADAVYSLSKGLPEGPQPIDAEITAADCRARGVPVS